MKPGYPEIGLCAFGSSILTDDGLTIKISNDISNAPIGKFLTFMQAHLISYEVMASFLDFSHIILLDVFVDPRITVGKILIKNPVEDIRALHLVNPHEGSFGDIYRYFETFSDKLPAQMTSILVNVEEVMQFSDEPSKPVSRYYYNIYYQVEKIIISILKTVCLKSSQNEYEPSL